MPDSQTSEPSARHAPRNGHDDAVVEKVRSLIEETTMSQRQIAEETHLSQAAISRLHSEHGWVRPAGAPTQPEALKNGTPGRTPGPAGRDRRAAQLIARLYTVCAKQIDRVDRRLADAKVELEEKDARALATLAKTVATLMTLDRDEGAKAADPDAVDPDAIRAKLAHRLFALGRSEG